MSYGEGIITEADVRAAQVFLDSLRGQVREELELRGALAAHLADVRVAGYLAGVQEGRRIVASVVRDALDGEGL